MQHREPFWLVWNPQGYNPQCKHNTEEGATREAERLARANPGQTFIVMESVGALVVDNIQRTDLRPGNDLPFWRLTIEFMRAAKRPRMQRIVMQQFPGESSCEF